MTRMEKPKKLAPYALIVDPDPAWVALCSPLLEEEGFEVLVAQDGE